jgi:hypothetical protein
MICRAGHCHMAVFVDEELHLVQSAKQPWTQWQRHQPDIHYVTTAINALRDPLAATDHQNI